MSTPSPTWRQLTLLSSILLLPLSLLIFASGFFPYKPVLPGLALLQDQISDDAAAELPPAPFDRVVFMVVDALRSDFVYGHHSGFTFTQSLVRSGAAIPFTAHATPPTVTMPRVKALTTGSVPSFLDLILNFAESDTSSSLASQDTWLAQLRSRPGGKLVFYGDDTWLKLFPGEGFFARQDGTSSFFVSDFTEVDNNVTRHIPHELKQSDWNGMVLHYLGLDHIGHKTGPDGPNMLPKQKEMDEIVRSIYTTIEHEPQQSRTLLVLAGDHGMNAGGNHGGSGPGETEPALLFASPQFAQSSFNGSRPCPTSPRTGTDFHFYNRIEQSDVVPTLSIMLGLPIPKNSLGVMLEDVLDLWTLRHQQTILLQNSAQLLTLLKSSDNADHIARQIKAYDEYGHHNLSDCTSLADETQMLTCKFAAAQHAVRSNDKDWRTAAYDFLHHAQKTLSGTASSYNLRKMACGVILALVSLSLALVAMSSLAAAASSWIFLMLTCMLYGAMMFASSYVEEEQHFWYWLTPAWFTMLACLASTDAAVSKEHAPGWRKYRRPLACITINAIHRLMISWNQTGQKHAGEPDLVHNFFPEHHQLMWLLTLASYVLICYQIASRTLSGLISNDVAAAIAVLQVFTGIVFKLSFTQADAPELVNGLAPRLRSLTGAVSLVAQARVVFALLSINAAMVSIVVLRRQRRASSISGITRQRFPASASLARRLQPLFSLFLATQTRAPNVPLISLMDVQSALLAIILGESAPGALHPSRGKVATLATSTLLLAYTSYFCFGGSNSISSLDLSQAYNGIADYNVLAVGVLLFASNWTGPIWWTFASSGVLADDSTTSPKTQGQASNKRSWVQEEHRTLHVQAGLASKDGAVTAGNGFAAWWSFVALLTVFHAASCVAIMGACTALRTHLFVWTVFSPKYLYTMAWTIGWHILINCAMGAILQVSSSVRA